MEISFVMTQTLEKCLCVKCYSSVKPQSDRLVEDKQAHTSHKMKNSVKSFCTFFFIDRQSQILVILVVLLRSCVLRVAKTISVT